MLHTLLSAEAKWTWYLFSFATLEDGFRTVAIWLTLLLAICGAVCAFVLRDEARAKFVRIASVVAICYACVIGIASLAFGLSDAGKEGEFLAILFVPLAALLVSIALWLTAIATGRGKALKIGAIVLVGLAAIATLVCMHDFYPLI